MLGGLSGLDRPHSARVPLHQPLIRLPFCGESCCSFFWLHKVACVKDKLSLSFVFRKMMCQDNVSQRHGICSLTPQDLSRIADCMSSQPKYLHEGFFCWDIWWDQTFDRFSLNIYNPIFLTYEITSTVQLFYCIILSDLLMNTDCIRVF